MGFATKNDVIAGRKPVPTPADCDVAAPRFAQNCVAADSGANNVGVIGILPAGFTPLGLIVDTSGLGGTAAISIGILNDAGTDLSTEAADGGAVWAASVAVSAAGATAVTPTRALMTVKPSSVDRKIAVKFTAAGASAGDLGVTVQYRSPI